MGMYEIPRNVKGERKNIYDFFHEITNMDSGNFFNRLFYLFDFEINKSWKDWVGSFSPLCRSWIRNRNM